MYQLRALGRLGLQSATHLDAAAIAGRAKPLALLAFLDAAPKRTASRASLCALFWEGSSESRARQTLRQTVHQLRRQLGDDAIVGEGDQLRLGDTIDSDRRRFLAQLDEGDDAAAVRTYTGPFLDGLAIQGARDFDGWVDLERTRLSTAFLAAAEREIDRLRAAGRGQEAAALARRARDEQPFRIEAWHRLIETSLLADLPIDAVVEAEALELMARREALELTTPTVRLLEQARSATRRRAGGVSGAASFVGRRDAIAAATAAWELAQRNRPAWLHLVGPAGIGKTRLLEELAERIDRVDATVAAVRAHPGERSVRSALAASVGAALLEQPGAKGADPASLAAVRALGAPGHDHPRDQASPLELRALADLVAAVSEARPLLLVVDDLHWADPTSSTLLAGLWHRSAELRLLVLSAGRPGPDAGLPEGVRTLSLEPFSSGETAALVELVGPTMPSEARQVLAGTVHSASGGNPLLAAETIRLLASRGAIEPAPDGTYRVGDLAEAAIGQQDVLGARLESLSPTGRRLVEVLAVAGVPVATAVAARAADVDPDAARAGLTELFRAGFADHVARGWQTSHDALAEVALDRGDARRAHAALGHALLDQPSASLSTLQAAGRHLLEAEDSSALREAWLRWLGQIRRLGDRSPAGVLAADFLQAEAPAALRRALVRATTPRRAVLVGIALAIAASTALLLGATQPYQLRVASLPVTGSPLSPAPVVEVQNWFGRALTRATGTVTASIADGIGRLGGTMEVPLAAGRATFEELVLDVGGVRIDDSTTLRFAYEGIHFDQRIATGQWSQLPLDLWLDGARLSTGPIDSSVRTITVSAGERITGQVRFRYTSRYGSASVLLGMTPTWGEPSSVWRTLRAVATPVERAPVTADLDVLAPAEPGRYRLIFAIAAEGNVAAMMSGTNWRLEPEWNDDNQLARLADSLLDRADREGGVTVDWDFITGRDPQRIGLTTITLVVEPGT
ncbi:MAG: AAA family ATPase [Gemmatimonadales bacterium]